VESYIKEIEQGLKAYEFGKQPNQLYEPIRYILSLGGKRMRPVLTLMACELFDTSYQKALLPALGVEVFHNFTLLHDDIMDGAPLRRGMATVHEKWNASTAILSGDVMLVKAYELFLASGSKDLKRILSKFSRCATELCEGQQYDMTFESVSTVKEVEYLEMIRLKTAALVAFSLELGAIIGGATEKTSDQLYDFGTNIGVGFQLKDDLLDVYADASKFGKQVGGDIIANKKTFLLIKALELAKGPVLNELKDWLGKKDFDPEEKVNAVKGIYEELNIKTICESKMDQYFDQALALFDSIDVSDDRKQPLKELITMLIKRER